MVLEVLVALRSSSLPEVEVEVKYKAVPVVKAESVNTKAEVVVVPETTEEVKV